MFNGIKVRREFSSLLNEIFLETRDEKRSEKINKLYKLNEVRKINNLTVPSGNAVCTLLAAFDPFQNLSMISLYERGKLSVFLGIDDIDYSSDNIGGTIVSSNERIIKYFKDSGIHHSARTISVFLYSPEFKPLWRTEQVDDSEPNAESFLTPNEEVGDPSLFYMESQLEDFLINNWEKTEFGKKYDLIEEDGALVSQQFRTDIGIIDILAKDKKTTQLVVIELKKSQT
ncbi:MAG: DUF91 domain-containing protein, partial [Candidatus Kerfeldbacteria bacterium]|nr:DUF91 domain-containing protein [Candidatus Kerfeldbacteria bacterium]